jgi:Skp family chaperone for outer membrane proteins
MSVKISQHFKHHPTQEEIDLKRAFSAVLADMTAMRTAITGITAKLDADAGVTDTNYAATHDPAALTLVA